MNYVPFFEPTGGKRSNHIETIYLRYRANGCTKEIHIVELCDADRYFATKMGVKELQENDRSFGYKVEESYAIIDTGGGDSNLMKAPFDFASPWGKFHLDADGELSREVAQEIVFIPKHDLWESATGYMYAYIYFKDGSGNSRNLCYTHYEKEHTGFRWNHGQRKGNWVLADIQPTDSVSDPVVCTPFIVRVDGWDGELAVYDDFTHISIGQGEGQEGEYVPEVHTKYQPVEFLKPGCLLDSNRGVYNHTALIELAKLYGMETDLSQEQLDGYPGNGDEDFDGSTLAEVIYEECMQAENYLNNHAVSPGYYLVYNDDVMIVEERVELA